MKSIPIKTPAMKEREAAYNAALNLVKRIDDDLDRDTRHYRNNAGVLLTRLNEVVTAILADDLMTDTPEMRIAA